MRGKEGGLSSNKGLEEVEGEEESRGRPVGMSYREASTGQNFSQLKEPPSEWLRT